VPLFHSNPIQHPQLFAVIPAAPETISGVTGAALAQAGTPNLVGGPQTIILGLGGSVAVQSSTPALLGGATALTVFIAKAPRAYLVPGGYSQPMEGGGGGHGGTGAAGGGPVTIVSSQLGRATLNFDLLVEDGSGYQPRATQTVVLTEFGRTLFSGCLKSVTAEPLNAWSFNRIVYHCLAADKSSLCDNRVVIKTYPAGTDVQTMILDIVANDLNGEGITTGGVNVSDTVDTDMVFTYDSVTAAFDRIASYTGAQWWVDMNGVLQFYVIANAPAAPFGISASSDNFRNFTSSESTSGYANKFYAVSNRIVLPSSSPGAGSAARTESYTLVNIGGQAWQQAAYNAGLAPGYILTQLPIQQLVGVKVNSTVYNVYSLATTPIGPAGWYYFGGISTAGVTFPNLVTLNPGDVVQVMYVPVFQNASVNTGTPLSGTCGSGIVEAVIQAPNILYQDQLDAIAAAYQARSGTIPFIITFETDVPGLTVGQALSVDLPTFPGLAATTAYVTQIHAVCGSRNAQDLGQGSSFRWSIEATTQQDLGNWLNYMERLIAAGKFPLPVPRYEIAQIIIGPGSSIASGTVNSNPDQVTNAGQIAQATIVAGTPPTGQDMLVDILVNGVSIFGSNPLLTVPAGSAANTVYTVSLFRLPALFVYTNDIITAVVTYRVLAANPTPASSVSARVFWSY